MPRPGEKKISKIATAFPTPCLWVQNETCTFILIQVFFVICDFGRVLCQCTDLPAFVYSLHSVHSTLARRPLLNIVKGARNTWSTCHTTRRNRGKYRHSKHHSSNLHLHCEPVGPYEKHPAHRKELMDMQGRVRPCSTRVGLPSTFK